VWAYALAGLVAVALLSADRGWLAASGQEDQFAEYLTAALNFVASIVVLAAYLSSDSEANTFFGWPTRRNLWLLLLALFFFVCFGEEISWGQRLIGWSTPETWKAINGHSETNLHNLLDSYKLTDERVLNAIVVVYGVILPLIDRFSKHGRRLLRWMGMPVPPLALAGIFVGVLVAHEYFKVRYPDWPASKAIREYAEAGFAAGYLIIAVSFLLRFRQSR
jgi:hypothetical protein